ncbi:protein of unknown function [Paenibacillus alvei]|uniref:Uncharacterized protein n=1 Tax=Paenibacillus alvei TaxID=44250 RepID=A0A383R3I7_PAEAL|nr:protein of unknown function [Paenibacillus alvei]
MSSGLWIVGDRNLFIAQALIGYIFDSELVKVKASRSSDAYVSHDIIEPLPLSLQIC